MTKRVTVADLIVQAIDKPKTAQEIADEIKVPVKAVRDRLVALLLLHRVVQVGNKYERNSK